MVWMVIAVMLGLALGVGVVLVLARPDSLHPTHKAPARRTKASHNPDTPAVPVARSQHRSPGVDPLAHKAGAKTGSVSLKPAAPPVPVAPLHNEPPGVHPPVDFPEAVVRAAWRRQGGRCAECGRLLIWANRNRDNGTGAWQSHHRIPRDQAGSSDLKNCVLFCSGTANCHFNIAHGGIGWSHYSPLEDSALLYLRCGAERADTTQPQTRTKPGLAGQVLGILVPGRAKRHSKPKSKQSRTSLPLPDDYDEAY